MLAAVESAISSDNAEALQQALFDLFEFRGADGLLDDEIAFAVIAILGRSDIKSSRLAAHLLNFFEFQAPHLSKRANKIWSLSAVRAVEGAAKEAAAQPEMTPNSSLERTRER